jgi:hypothetical protein
MKVRILWCAVLLLGLVGCTSPDPAFVTAVDKAWSAVGPRYTAYVKADATLQEGERETILRTAELLTLTIEEAKK